MTDKIDIAEGTNLIADKNQLFAFLIYVFATNLLVKCAEPS